MVEGDRALDRARSRTGERRMPRHVFLQKTRRNALYLLLVVAGFINLYPFLYMLSASLKGLPEYAAGGLNLIPKKVIWQNYATAWQEAEFARYFINTVIYATVPTVTSLLTSAMGGYALGRKRLPGRKTYIGLLLILAFIPGGLTIVPVFEIIWKLGLLKSYLGVLLPGLVGGGMQALLFMGYFSSVSTGAAMLEDAAIIDGANFFQIFGRVMIPLARPMFAVLGVLSFIGGWNSFLWPLVVSLGNTNLRSITVGLFAFRGEQVTEWTLLMAGTTIALIPIIVLFFFAQRWIIEGLAGAIKM